MGNFAHRQNSETAKSSKLQFLSIWQLPNLFSRKIWHWIAANFSNFYTVSLKAPHSITRKQFHKIFLPPCETSLAAQIHLSLARTTLLSRLGGVLRDPDFRDVRRGLRRTDPSKNSNWTLSDLLTDFLVAFISKPFFQMSSNQDKILEVISFTFCWFYEFVYWESSVTLKWLLTHLL